MKPRLRWVELPNTPHYLRIDLIDGFTVLPGPKGGGADLLLHLTGSNTPLVIGFFQEVEHAHLKARALIQFLNEEGLGLI